jgi:hypothetical protein
MSHVGFNIDPLKCALINPHRPFHASEYLAISIGWFIALAWRRFEHINVIAVEASFSGQVEVERGRHLLNESLIAIPVCLVFGDSLGSLVRRLMLPFRDCFLIFLLFLFLF